MHINVADIINFDQIAEGFLRRCLVSVHNQCEREYLEPENQDSVM